jgi:hypothetical protein
MAFAPASVRGYPEPWRLLLLFAAAPAAALPLATAVVGHAASGGHCRCRTMIGISDSSTGMGVASPRMTLESTTLNAGSRVLTVCVKLMATAANEMLAATWPMACMAAGPKMFLNSCLVTGCEGGSTGGARAWGRRVAGLRSYGGAAREAAALPPKTARMEQRRTALTRPNDQLLRPMAYTSTQYTRPTTTWMVDTV